MFELTGLAESFNLTPMEAAQLIFSHETEIAAHHWDA